MTRTLFGQGRELPAPPLIYLVIQYLTPKATVNRFLKIDDSYYVVRYSSSSNSKLALSRRETVLRLQTVN